MWITVNLAETHSVLSDVCLVPPSDWRFGCAVNAADAHRLKKTVCKTIYKIITKAPCEFTYLWDSSVCILLYLIHIFKNCHKLVNMAIDSSFSSTPTLVHSFKETFILTLWSYFLVLALLFVPVSDHSFTMLLLLIQKLLHFSEVQYGPQEDMYMYVTL